MIGGYEDGTFRPMREIVREEFGEGNYYLNPGSATYPKEGNPNSYMIYENRCFTVKDFEGNVIFSKQF